ncbi:uncharacterized protein LOC131602421 [Vicia villosa]|uniref:uncharacterized protein LOC131602421 n=1 Tax=Vicia villosa TaxID=3911 RepID=UPI00273BC8C3|nr:uncharacterized protein LOC131602421 [Vicia villosa]
MAGRMLKWSLELSEFDIQYESRKALKAQVLADFVAEMTIPGPLTPANDEWTIFVDGASSSSGSGADIILENNEGETPFRLTYGTEAVIPVEIREPSRRTELPLEEELNDEAMREELDMVEEIRLGASLRETKIKQQITLRHDAKVIKREFEVGSLVHLRNKKDSRDGKLAPNWEGPYRVYEKTEHGAYYLENLLGEKLARPWNAEKLHQYYS